MKFIYKPRKTGKNLKSIYPQVFFPRENTQYGTNETFLANVFKCWLLIIHLIKFRPRVVPIPRPPLLPDAPLVVCFAHWVMLLDRQTYDGNT